MPNDVNQQRATASAARPLTFKEFLDEAGYAILPALLSIEVTHQLLAALADTSPEKANQRNILLRIPLARELAFDGPPMHIARDVLGAKAHPVRGILFDKTPASNWKVAWHQDLAIAVAEKHDVAGYGPWSIKDGVHHVRAPVDVLNQMVTVRIHLDNCTEENGPLRVLSRSHKSGIIPEAEIPTIRDCFQEVTCTCPSGGAVLIRPLILHASSPATQPSHRRVLHIEYANCNLPPPLKFDSV